MCWQKTWLKYIIIACILSLCLSSPVYSQASFRSNTTSGNWNASGSWTLLSGEDSDGVPDADDNVTIRSGDQINIRNGNQACSDLSIVGNLNYTRNRTLTVNGNLVMSESATLTGDNAARVLDVSGTFTVSSGANVSISGQDITIDGLTTIEGILNILHDKGNKTFGSINVVSGGTWNNNSSEDFTINGNITHNGQAWNSCSNTACDYTLTSTAGAISGNSVISIGGIIIDGSASYTNIGTVLATDRLTGTGTFINGTNGSLSYSGDGDFDITSFTASAIGNTVTYNGTSDQVFRVTTDTDNNYYNVVINTSAAENDLTLASNITIDNQLTLTTGDVFLASNRLTLADGATISGGNVDSYIGIDGSGVFRQNYSTSGATLAFPLGATDDFSPIIALTISSATFGASPFLDFSISDLDHPSRDVDNTAAGGDDDGTAAVDYISRFWTIAANDITSPQYSASYVYVDADVTGTEANMIGTLYRTPPGEGFQDWAVIGVVNAGTNTVSISNGDAFGDLYAMDNTVNRLPIVLISFVAKVTKSTVVLEWVTASEANNDFYTVERSLDGRNFYPMLTLGGAGDSEELLNYKATDKSPLFGRSFYRLKQTDFNGQFEYSEIRSVFYRGHSEALDISIYPNPINANAVLKVKIPSVFLTHYLRLQLVDQFGRSVNVKYQLGEEGIYMQTTNLKAGLYIVHVTDGISQAKKKVIVR